MGGQGSVHKKPKTVWVIGVPTNWGQPRPGVEQGPAALRRAGLLTRLADEGWAVEDQGDLPVPRRPPEAPTAVAAAREPKNARQVGDVAKRLAEDMAAPLRQGKFALVLGGDHSMTIGSVAAALKADPRTAVVYVDAHGDINTPETTITRNIHGMPLSFLAGLGSSRRLQGFGWMRDYPALPSNRLVYVGLRDLDPLEKDILRDHRILAFSMHEVDELGIGEVARRILRHLGDSPLHLSLDVDALDPKFFTPATGTVARGGLTYREARYLAEVLGGTGQLRSMDVAEVNPLLASDEGAKETVDTAVDVVSAAMGKQLMLPGTNTGQDDDDASKRWKGPVLMLLLLAGLVALVGYLCTKDSHSGSRVA